MKIFLYNSFQFLESTCRHSMEDFTHDYKKIYLSYLPYDVKP